MSYQKISKLDEATSVPGSVKLASRVASTLIKQNRLDEAEKLIVDALETHGGCDHAGTQGTGICCCSLVDLGEEIMFRKAVS